MTQTFDQQLAQFEQDRLTLLNQLKKPALLRKSLIVLAVGAFFFTFWASLAVGVIWFVIYAVEYQKKQKFSKRFQSEIVPHMFGRMSTETLFNPHAGLTKEQIGKCGMLIQALDNVTSSNKISGIITGKKFEMAKLTATFITKNAKGQKNTSQGFTGHALLFELLESQDQHFYIFPKTGFLTILWYKILKEDLPRMGFNKKQTQNQAFDNSFEFFVKEGVSELPVELINNLPILKDKLDQKAKTQIGICKSANHFFLAIHWNADLFGFTLEKNVAEEVKETLEEIKLCLDLPVLVLSKI